MEKIKAVILGSPGAWHTQTLTAALRKRGVEPVFGDAARLQVRLGSSPGVTAEATFLSDADLVLVRDVPGGTLEQVIYRMDALHQLENGGVRVINSPYAIEKMVDKYYALSLLQDAGLRVPETRLTESPSEALEAFHSLGGDVVVKPLFGSRGVGMVRVTETDTAGRVFRALQLGGYVYYLQKYIPHNNRDQRVMVIGEECVAAMERVADSWKTNIAAGAWPIRTEVTSDMRDVCLQAARRLEADYCGVDLLRSEAGELFVLEVNSMPAWQGLQEVTPFDVADRIVKYCFDVIQRKS